MNAVMTTVPPMTASAPVPNVVSPSRRRTSTRYLRMVIGMWLKAVA